MAADPYATLGVSKTASEDEIRKAYRDLAKKLHPDLNPGDAAAAERFKAVASAYEILKDSEKRARYDRGEIDGSGAEKPQQRYYRDYADQADARRYQSSSSYEDMGDISDLFSDLFGGRGAGQGGGFRSSGFQGRGGAGFQAKGQDARYRLEVDFLDAVKGATRRITTPDGRSIDLKIPPGIEDGQSLRMKGEGAPGSGGAPSGDALVEVAIRPHPHFTREGDDILLDLPVTLDEAVLGAKVEAPTIDGKVALTVPAGANSGQVLRLRGKGVKSANGSGRGDQLVRLLIVSPPAVDDELKGFMEKWRSEHAYDPRKGLWRTP